MAKSGSRTSRGSQSSMNSVVLIAALAIGAVLFSTTAMKNGGGGGGSDVVLDPNLDTDGDGVIEANELVTVAKPAQLNNDLDLDGDGTVEDHELDENFFARHRVSLLCASTSVIILFAVLYMQKKQAEEKAVEAAAAQEAQAQAEAQAREDHRALMSSIGLRRTATTHSAEVYARKIQAEQALIAYEDEKAKTEAYHNESFALTKYETERARMEAYPQAPVQRPRDNQVEATSYKGPTGKAMTAAHIWEYADKNGNGSISKGELKKAVTSDPEIAQFLKTSPNEAKKLFADIDTDGSGGISKDEFMIKFDPAYEPEQPVQEVGSESTELEARKLFKLMDVNGDGNLAQKEIQAFIKTHAVTVLSQYFGYENGEKLSNKRRTKRVREFCESIAALDGTAKSTDGSYDVSEDDFVQGYIEQIQAAVLSATN